MSRLDDGVRAEALRVVMNCVYKNPPMLDAFFQAKVRTTTMLSVHHRVTSHVQGIDLFVSQLADTTAFVARAQPVQVRCYVSVHDFVIKWLAAVFHESAVSCDGAAP